LLAGGGVKRGFVYGESDKTGSYPTKDPVRPDDLAATMFYLLGIDPNTEVAGLGNRPVLISEGKPVMGFWPEARLKHEHKDTKARSFNFATGVLRINENRPEKHGKPSSR